MTAVCATFDQIESRTAISLSLAIQARRMRERVSAATVGRALLFVLNHKLTKLTVVLRSGALEHLEEEKLREVAGLLKPLHACLLRLTQDSELKSYASLTTALSQVEYNKETVESVLENIYLSLDPKFRKAVTLAINKLDLGVEERAAVLR